MIRRRDFITLLGGAAAWPLAARAQHPEKVARVGFLAQGTAGSTEAPAGPNFKFFLAGLRERGWIEGQWTELESKRRVKVYSLTKSGRARLVVEKRTWQKIFTAMNRVLAKES